MMKVKWNGQTEFLVLTHGKIYEVLSVEKGWYRIKDDSGEDYLYPPDGFEIVPPHMQDILAQPRNEGLPVIVAEDE